MTSPIQGMKGIEVDMVSSTTTSYKYLRITEGGLRNRVSKWREEFKWKSAYILHDTLSFHVYCCGPAVVISTSRYVSIRCDTSKMILILTTTGGNSVLTCQHFTFLHEDFWTWWLLHSHIASWKKSCWHSWVLIYSNRRHFVFWTWQIFLINVHSRLSTVGNRSASSRTLQYRSTPYKF